MEGIQSKSMRLCVSSMQQIAKLTANVVLDICAEQCNLNDQVSPLRSRPKKQSFGYKHHSQFPNHTRRSCWVTVYLGQKGFEYMWVNIRLKKSCQMLNSYHMTTMVLLSSFLICLFLFLYPMQNSPSGSLSIALCRSCVFYCCSDSLTWPSSTVHLTTH